MRKRPFYPLIIIMSIFIILACTIIGYSIWIVSDQVITDFKDNTRDLIYTIHNGQVVTYNGQMQLPSHTQFNISHDLFNQNDIIRYEYKLKNDSSEYKQIQKQDLSRTYTYRSNTTAPGPLNAGQYLIKIVYDSNRTTGENAVIEQTTEPVTFTINPKPVTITWSNTNLVYNGTNQSPSATVSNLESGDSCEVTISNNTCIDTGTYYKQIENIDNPNYTMVGAQNLSINFNIEAKSIGNAEVLLDSDIYIYIYNGNEIKPNIHSITVDGLTLTPSDYDVSYDNNTNVTETAKVIITGIGNFKDTKEVTFKIDPKPITNATFDISNNNYTYDRNEHQPSVSNVVIDGNTLDDTNYQVGYQNNINAGTATVTITGIGNYTGTVQKEFTVSKASLSNATVNLDDSIFTYNTLEHEPSVTSVVTTGNITLYSFEYNIQYQDNKNAGTAIVKITSLSDNFEGTVDKQFTINKANINDLNVALTPDTIRYTGNPLTPSVNIKIDNIDISNSNYDTTYSNHTNVGTANVTINGKNNLTGERTLSFTISKGIHVYTPPTSKSDLVYTGDLQTLINEGNSTTGTMEYKVGTDSYSVDLPTRKNAQTYNIDYKIPANDYYEELIGTISSTISPKQLKFNGYIIGLDYNSTSRTYNNIKSNLASSIKNKLGIFDADLTSIAVTINGIHDGTFGYGDYYSDENYNIKSITGIDKSDTLVGSTYYINFTINTNSTILQNYIFENNPHMYLKYKTVNVNGTLYTIEDAINENGNMVLSKGTSLNDYVYTAFSNLNTIDNPYKDSNKNYIVDNETLVVPSKKEPLSSVYSLNNVLDIDKDNWGVNTTSNDYNVLVSALFIPDDVVVEFVNRAKLYIDGEISTTQPNTTISSNKGVILNRGKIIIDNSLLLSFGYLKGEGENALVECKGESQVLDMLAQYDYPGGNTINELRNISIPIVSWSIHNVSCKTKINTLSSYYGFYYTHANVPFFGVQHARVIVNIIEQSNCLYKYNSSTGGAEAYLIKRAEIPTGLFVNNQMRNSERNLQNGPGYQKDIIEIYNGKYSDEQFSISIGTPFGTVTVTTGINKPMTIPHMDIIIHENSELSLNKSSYVFMPGTKIDVKGKLNLGEGVNLSLETLEHVVDLKYVSAYDSSGVEIYTDGSSNFKKFVPANTPPAIMEVSGIVESNGYLGGYIVSKSTTAQLKVTNNKSSFEILFNGVGNGAYGYMAYKVENYSSYGPFNNGNAGFANNTTYTSNNNNNNNFYWEGNTVAINSGTSKPTQEKGTRPSPDGGGGDSGGGCITSDTLITLFDGTIKRIDELLPTDLVLTFNHETGEFEGNYLILNDSEPEALYNILELQFDDNSYVKLVDGHVLFNKTLNKYVHIDISNVDQYIGHEFVKVEYINGNIVTTLITLNNYSIYEEYTKIYSPLTSYHYNSIANNILTKAPLPCGYGEICNFFDCGEEMIYEQEQMNQDIELYGLFAYEEFSEYMTEDVFNALNAKYFKIWIGKGYITMDDIFNMLVFVEERINTL